MMNATASATRPRGAPPQPARARDPDALVRIGLEATALIVTCPLIVALTGFGWQQALAAGISLTLAYAVYGFFFHLGFDRLRTVRAGATGAR